ncbi:MAG: hypothetical protein IT462_02480 [Planctomycetes bacterium]|nr:hypothetical protein [Planctomycetota bacterium]
MEPLNEPASKVPLVNPDLLGDLVPMPTRRRNFVVRALAGLAALLLTIIGIVGIIMPIIPGWPFLVLVPPLMGVCSERTRGWVNWLDRRMPLRVRLWIRPRSKKVRKRDLETPPL